MSCINSMVLPALLLPNIALLLYCCDLDHPTANMQMGAFVLCCTSYVAVLTATAVQCVTTENLHTLLRVWQSLKNSC